MKNRRDEAAKVASLRNPLKFFEHGYYLVSKDEQLNRQFANLIKQTPTFRIDQTRSQKYLFCIYIPFIAITNENTKGLIYFNRKGSFVVHRLVQVDSSS